MAPSSRTLTYRVCYLPVSFCEAQLPLLFSPSDRSLILHTSIAPGIDGLTQTATVTFRHKPLDFSELKPDEILHLTPQIACSTGERPVQVEIQIDTGFRGLTPLNITNNENAVVYVPF
jgi:hypothetical protein